MLDIAATHLAMHFSGSRIHFYKEEKRWGAMYLVVRQSLMTMHTIKRKGGTVIKNDAEEGVIAMI